MSRVASAIGLFSIALLLGGCSASDKLFDAMQAPAHAIIDKLPEWAGGPPKTLPPRPGDPGYAAYELQVEGKAAPAPTSQAAAASSSQSSTAQAAPASADQKAALDPLH
jgi:hypothetical protein